MIYDVDDVHNEEQYNDAITYFNNLSEVLGDYSIAEYTTDDELAKKYNIPKPTGNNPNYTEINKYYSAHVVFYQRKIHINTLKELFATYKNRELNQTVFLNDGIKYQDISIWKDLCNGKGRIMRVALSDKICGNWLKEEKKMEWTQFKPTHTIVTDRFKNALPPSTNLISIKPSLLDSLQEITRDDLIACGIVFNNREDKVAEGCVVQKYLRNANVSKTIDMKKLNKLMLHTDSYDKTLIAMSIEELTQLLNIIYDSDREVKYETGNKIVSILCHQACHVFTDPTVLGNVLTQWYNNNTTHQTPEAMRNYINSYYGKDVEVSNKWFYSLLRYVNPKETAKKTELLNKYGTFICDSIDMNNYNPTTSVTINQIQRKRYAISVEVDEDEHEYIYKLTGLYELINDLKQCVGYCNGNYYIITNDAENMIKVCSKQNVLDTYITHPFGNDITLASIMIRYVDYFIYDKVVFCTEQALKKLPKTERYINLFRGWNANDKENKAYEAMFARLLKALCNDSEDEFNEVAYRLSYIINNVTHTDVVEYFQGLCGTGKGTLVKILGMFAENYIVHVNSIDDVLHENSMLEGSIFVFMNELPKYNENKANDQSHFKEYITDDYIKIRDLYIKKHSAPNSCNYFVFTNNINAISLSYDDRRFNIHNTSSVLDEQFFNDINAAMEEHHDEFRDAVYHYLLHWIGAQYNIRKPMNTEARTDLIAATTNQYEWWIQNHKAVYQAFAIDGIANFTTAIEELLRKYPPEGKILSTRTIKSWQTNLKTYFNTAKRHTRRIKGKRFNVYLLLDKFIESFAPVEEETVSIDLNEEEEEEEEGEEVEATVVAISDDED